MSILQELRERTEPLNVKELAVLFNVTEDTIQKWVRRRMIPALRVGDVIRFDSQFLADWIEAQLTATEPGTGKLETPKAKVVARENTDD